jgi:curved DNA-binding protein CbpA
MPEEHWPVRGEDAYAILGVSPDSDDAAIAAAFRSLARRHHPDIAGEEATRRMSRINAAWDLLRDPARREAYDAELDAADVAAGRPATRTARQRARRARRAAAPEAPGRAVRGDPQFTPPTGAHDPTRPPYGWTPERDGTAGAGPPPGRPSGSVLQFGRHLGWSLGEIARVDPGYLEWLEGRREGRPYLDEIDELLVRVGFRSVAKRPRPAVAQGRRRRRLGRT